MNRLYRQNPKNDQEMFEYLGNYMTPSGRVFTRIENPPPSTNAVPVIEMKDRSTATTLYYILTHIW
jgi:hypothetical protein